MIKLPDTPEEIVKFFKDPEKAEAVREHTRHVTASILMALDEAGVDIAVAATALMYGAAVITYATSHEGGGPGGNLATGAGLAIGGFCDKLNELAGEEVVVMDGEFMGEVGDGGTR